MRIIRLFKRDIIKSTYINNIHILFRFGIYKKLYDLYDSSMAISNYSHDNKIVKRISNEPNHWVHYNRYINNVLMYEFKINKFFDYSHEYYFINKCLIKSIRYMCNNYTYKDYEYEKTESYNLNPKVKNSIINKIFNSKLFQFIRYI